MNCPLVTWQGLVFLRWKCVFQMLSIVGNSGQLWVNAVTQGYSRQQWAILIQGNSVPNASVLLGGKSGHTSDYLLTQFGFSHHLHRYSYFLLLRWDRWGGSNIRKSQCSHRKQNSRKTLTETGCHELPEIKVCFMIIHAELHQIYVQDSDKIHNVLEYEGSQWSCQRKQI